MQTWISKSNAKNAFDRKFKLLHQIFGSNFINFRE